MVSVIIPAYNCAKYLRRCVDSILGQTYSDIECIIVNDGSTDNQTPQLCEEIKNEDNRVRVIHKENGGDKRAREDGFKASSGQYIMFVDADDWLEREIVMNCLNAIEETGTDVVCYDYVFNDDGKIGFSIKTPEIIDAQTAIKYILSFNKMDGNTWCKFYRRKVIDNIVFDKRRSCDFVTVINILQNAEKILLFPEIGYHYSIIKGSLSRNNICDPHQEDFVNASYEVYVKYANYPYIKTEAEYFWLYTLLYVCIKMEKDRNLSRKSLRFKKIKQVLRKEIKTYYKNKYTDTKGKIQYLLCYLNLFRPMYTFYEFVSVKKEGEN